MTILLRLVSLIVRVFSSIGSAIKSVFQIRRRTIPKITFADFRAPAQRSMRYIVMHSYHAQQKRKRRSKAIARNLSYVSSAILEDYGEILPRRQRKLLAKSGISFTPYYN